MKSTIWKSVFVLMAMLTLNACKDDDEDVKLSQVKAPYTGTLKTNGYYYLDFNSDVSRKLIYILYRDGTILYGGSPPNTGLTAREEEFKNGDWKTLSVPEKTFWGTFKIDGSAITFCQWHLRDGGLLEEYKTYGSIINDSSFVMTGTTRTGQINAPIDELYHFKPLSPKPDSTNQFLN